MGSFRLFKKRTTEERADETLTGEALLRALIGSTTVTKEMALEIPTIKSSLERIANTVSALPIKLYKTDGEIVEEIIKDPRLKLLNRDTGDTLTANQFWKAIIVDYFLGKGGYAYINKAGTRYESLHYTDESKVTFTESVDPIFKSYNIQVQGKPYEDYEFFKILRNTKNGITGKSLIDENPLALSVGYVTFQMEDALLRKGGGQKGYIESERELSTTAMDALKLAFKNLYSNNNEEKVVILNKGLSFKSASSTANDMQLNENKESNTTQLSMLLNVSSAILRGKATKEEKDDFINAAVMPVIVEIESSLDRDFLTEKEKENGYFYAIDTKEITRGNIKERFEAYAIALKNNFMQIDEVRKQEDLKELGFKWITLGLQNVLLNPETMEIYTPNTNSWQKLNDTSQKGGEIENESGS